ncbi:MAG: 16S rRNA (cytidine(1402)-2'-O)-methyltransferase [Patescibacteria group bacterium]
MKLYIVATPIGNLQDISLRAIEVLKSVQAVLCEDTRNSKKLMDAYGIRTRLISYHQHSTPDKVKQLIGLIKNNREAALITDAGTPGISDPGNKFIEAVLESLGEECQIIPIPGPSAIIAALSISGLPTDRFIFLGFLPHKKGRETTFNNILNSSETVVFYESKHRIFKTMERLAEIMPKDRRLMACRELTKKFETVYRGNAGEVLLKMRQSDERGEFVIVVEGK